MSAFSEHYVWITGGGSGIGHALALEFARQGAHVAVSGRRTERLEAVVAEIEALGRQGLAVPVDVTDDDAVKAAVASIIDHWGRLDVCVANAGMGVTGRFERLTDAEWRRQFDVNVFGAVSTVRHALPALRESGGRIALIASVAGMMCAPGAAAYSASKYALRAIGQTLSMELHGTGVSCTNVHPGFVESEINQVDNQGRFDASRTDRRPQKIMWTAERAARVVVRAIHRRKREFTFTGHGKFAGFLGRHWPGSLHFAMTRFGGKKSAALTENK